MSPPMLNQGGHMCKVELEKRAKAWSFSLSQYVKAAIKVSQNI